MKQLELFAGIGGFGLAGHWAGIETVCQVEIDPFCRRVLEKNFPIVPQVAYQIFKAILSKKQP